ncbi:uncharacterized protein LOC103756067 isoform X2 [Manacus vitellinus]|nr:uncharacterized protein LOC103756067 isoform X2 [Manacus vitellinus]
MNTATNSPGLCDVENCFSTERLQTCSIKGNAQIQLLEPHECQYSSQRPEYRGLGMEKEDIGMGQTTGRNDEPLTQGSAEWQKPSPQRQHLSPQALCKKFCCRNPLCTCLGAKISLFWWLVKQCKTFEGNCYHVLCLAVR